mgnify:CR=1
VNAIYANELLSTAAKRQNCYDNATAESFFSTLNLAYPPPASFQIYSIKALLNIKDSETVKWVDLL